MKLKSTMKHRRLKSRLLISMLTVTLRFSYLLISKENVFHALIREEYVYSDYSVTVKEDSVTKLTNGTGTSAITTLYGSVTISIDMNGYYDGKYQLLISSINTSQWYSYEAINCNITDFTVNNNSWSIDLQIYGVQHFEFKINYNRSVTGTGVVTLISPLFSSVSGWYNKAYVCSSPTYLVERINSKLSDLKNNTDGIEGALTTIANSLVSTNTNLVTINSNLIDMYNRQNVTNSKLDDIIEAINGIDITIDNDIETEIEYYNDQQVAINNIINNYINNSHVGSELYQGFLSQEVNNAFNYAERFASTIQGMFNIENMNHSLNFFVEDYFMVMTRAIILIALLG